MQIQILISTMNRQSISELKLGEKNIFKDCIIINQITKDNLKLVNEELKDEKIKMISYREKGLSKSRNRALENSTGDILLLTDDDISFFDQSFEIIKKKFLENDKYDILTFKFAKENKELMKKYKNKEFNHNRHTIRRVSSVEIALKRCSILENGIRYDENFGLGSKYISGEENIFLKDCLDKNLKIKYIPEIIVMHPNESISTPYYWTKEYIKGKGPLFYRLYGRLGYILYIMLIFIRKKRLKNVGLFKSISLGLTEIKGMKK